MKLVKVEINNFKSIGEYDNVLFLNDVNVVVGKNESGKSNIIDALAGIGHIGLMDSDYFYCNNRITGKDVSLKLYFDSYPNEEFDGQSIVEIKSVNDLYIYGAISEYIEKNSKINSLYKDILELNDNGLGFAKADNQLKANKLIEMLSERVNKIIIEPDFYKEYLNALKKSTEVHRVFIQKVNEIFFQLDEIYCCFPFFVKIQNETLKSNYLLKDIEDDFMLEELLDICEIDINSLKEVVNSTNLAFIKNEERKMNKKIEKFFTSKFNNFYPQENVVLELAISTGKLGIVIDTTSNYFSYDERSNGLKWYLNIFIQLLYMEKENCHVEHNNVILIDEPGVYLHANAQKELYSLFKDLTHNQNQIVFTTHSPFMLDSGELQNVRAVIKDDDGVSHIHNKITTISAKNNSTYDTITPLVYALGLDLNNNIGPNCSKKNIIVEGISDYFYLNSYFELKEVSKEERPNIIPSTGADNIIPIASILFGWGCDFSILLDQDDKGRVIYDKLDNKNPLILDKLMFVDGSNLKGTNTFEVEDLFSDNDKMLLGITSSDYNERKYNYSYIIYNGVINKEIVFDDETMSNFDNLNII